MPAPYQISDHRDLASDNLSGFIQNLQNAWAQNPSQGSSIAAGTTLRNSIVTTQAIAATETLILNIPVLPGVTLKAGSLIRCIIQGTYTSAGAQTVTITLRAGTLGTASDASVVAPTLTSAGSGTAIAFTAQLVLTVQTLGAAGTATGMLTVNNGGTTGITTTVANAPVAVTSSTLATTTASFLDLTMTAGTGNSASVTAASIEIIV